MFFKKCDFLSPQITLYFKGEKIHSSIISGIITIIAYSFIFIFVFCNMKDFIYKEKPIIYYYNKYVEDTGIYSIDYSSLFHFFQLININGELNINFDYDIIRIIGIDKSIDNYMRNYDLSKINHWVYGPCEHSKIKDDEIDDILPEDIFHQSACIKKYYNYISKKYSNIGESDFKWPVLSYGSSNPNKTIYGILIEKCQNDSLKNNCKSIEEINNFFDKYRIILNIINQYADILNYQNPYTKYIYTLTSELHSGTIRLNNIIFNPSLTKTHVGFFSDKIIDKNSYSFSQNEIITLSPSNTNIVTAFFFGMHNVIIYNERIYKKFHDFLSDIGGFGSFVLFVAISINSLVTNYIIVLDTEELILNMDKVNNEKNNLFQKPFIYKRSNELFHPPKKNNYINKNKANKIQPQNSLFPSYTKDNDSNISDPLNRLFLNYKNHYRNDNSSLVSQRYIKKNNSSLFLLNKNYTEKKRIYKFNEIKLQGENFFKLKKKNAKKKNYEAKEKRSEKSKKNKKMKTFEKIKKIEIIAKSIKKNNFTWINYFCHLILCKKYNKSIKYFEDFRAQIISEENLFQNYLDIFQLLKICNVETIKPYNNFKKTNYSMM